MVNTKSDTTDRELRIAGFAPEDVVTPEDPARIARLIPGSRLVILPGLHGALIGTMEAGAGQGHADMVAWLVDEWL